MPTIEEALAEWTPAVAREFVAQMRDEDFPININSGNY